MPLWPRVLSLWRNVFRGEQVDRDLDEELRAHLDLLIEEKVSSGMSPAEARRAALLEFGGIVFEAGNLRKEGRDVFSIVDAVLREPVAFLDERLRRIASGQLEVQLAFKDRKPGGVLLEAFEEFP